MFIVGRAIAGLGCAGMFSGALIIIAYSVPLRKRPAYTGIVGAVYGVASVAGPLLGGMPHSVSYIRIMRRILIPIRSFHRRGHLEMVFLHQPPHWRHHRRGHDYLLQVSGSEGGGYLTLEGARQAL